MSQKKHCDECAVVILFGSGFRLHRIDSLTGELETSEDAEDFCSPRCLADWIGAEYLEVPPADVSIANARAALTPPRRDHALAAADAVGLFERLREEAGAEQEAG